MAALAIGACSDAVAPEGHPLSGAWRGAATFTPSTARYQSVRSELAFSVTNAGELTGSLRTASGESAALSGTVERDGALHVRFDRFSVEGRLQRAPRDHATGAGVQREGGTQVGVLTFDLARP